MNPKTLLFVGLVILSGSSMVQARSYYTDSYGNTTGTIGGNRLNLNTDPFGNTTGTIGGGRVNCYTDPYGNTTCY